MNRADTFMARLAGAVSLALGIGLAILAIWMVERQLTLRGAIESIAAALITFLFVISAFCSLVGYRLLFNRPNRYGSLLSPAGWNVLAAFLGILGMGLAAVAIWREEYLLLMAPLGLGVLGYACVIAGRAASVQPTVSHVFPPETALLQMEGFVPPGFRCGIEVLNDDRTPMQFVVSVLCNAVGLSNTDAVRTMLDIHTKGGVLISMGSPEASRLVADAVTAEARRNNHPLVCRAVGVEE